eukprot:TRINITY_DN2425_c0_g2_i1.p1 TRINITY_DN2425_c0_g2~~TRINITY_DN2425_c0_g2_i1.p1  ORF type:complete len:256 (+),score=30.20 TRINITY_DN2425_c0_g2_i1:106-768(+)
MRRGSRGSQVSGSQKSWGDAEEKPTPYGFGSRAPRFQKGIQTPKAISPSGHWCEVDPYHEIVGPGSYLGPEHRDLARGLTQGTMGKTARFMKGIQTPKALSPSGHWCEVDEYHEKVGPGYYHSDAQRSLTKNTIGGTMSKTTRFMKGIQTPKALSPSGHWCEVDEYHEKVGPGSYHHPKVRDLGEEKPWSSTVVKSAMRTPRRTARTQSSPNFDYSPPKR